MSEITLVHLSDLHFAADEYYLDPESAIRSACDAISEMHAGAEIVVAITGDITTKGRPHGYYEAARVIRSALLPRLNPRAVVVCPGNHDIASGSPRFGTFNRFAFDVTGNANLSWTSQRPVRTVQVDEYSFVLINSAYHGDHTYGQVPMHAVREVLNGAEIHNAIVLLHHSPISSAYGGAALTNAYELLAQVSNSRALGVLHGHIHSELVLTFGRRPTFLSGVGSLSFKPEPNMNNQFSVHVLRDGALASSTAYRYATDRQQFIATGMPR